MQTGYTLNSEQVEKVIRYYTTCGREGEIQAKRLWSRAGEVIRSIDCR